MEDPNADTGEQNLSLNKRRAFIGQIQKKYKYKARSTSVGTKIKIYWEKLTSCDETVKL